MPAIQAFAVFAEMRTGSNFLEANLNAIDGVTCMGEAFNPSFLGYPDTDRLLGFTIAQRDANPLALLDGIRLSEGLNGFRFFHDHDPRILQAVLEDRRIAKVVLTRDPLDSYVSWKIAQATGQWKLTNVKRRKATKAVFDADEYSQFEADIHAFRATLRTGLQTTGQAAFFLSYEELKSLDVINGLAQFLGVKARLSGLDKSLKVQNPGALKDKVSNMSELTAALARRDPLDASVAPEFEPQRAAAVPNYVAAAKAPLLFMPIKGGPGPCVEAWLAALDQVDTDALQRSFSQKALRQWKRQRAGHRSFAVLRHPVARAHTAFCRHILSTGPLSYGKIRATLMQRFDLNVPEGDLTSAYDLAAHRAAFATFLDFVKANLTGQTAIRVDGAWCTQAEVIRGFAGFAAPDRLIRERDMTHELAALATAVGCGSSQAPMPEEEDTPFGLAEVYTDKIEEHVRDVYQRDYMMFGFDAWSRERA